MQAWPCKEQNPLLSEKRGPPFIRAWLLPSYFRGLLSSSSKAHEQKTYPTLQPSIQGPWGCTTVTFKPPPQSTQKPEICSTLQPPGGLGSYTITSLPGQDRNEAMFLLHILLCCCAYTVLRQFSLCVHLHDPTIDSAPSQPGMVPLGCHRDKHAASTQGCWWGDFLSRGALLSGPAHFRWSWLGGVNFHPGFRQVTEGQRTTPCPMSFSSFPTYQNVVSVLISSLQGTVT